ncbi:MAG: SRPBCC family protein [Deltaproteobacteria bacterium]|nr:SRPBCC family protein [Deltaproteobacteria bacterium]
MRFIPTFIFFTLILCLSATGVDDCGLKISTEKGKDGKRHIRASFNLKADPDEVYNTLLDVELFPEFMPGSADVKMVEKSSDYQIVRFSGNRGLLSGDVVMKRIRDLQKRQIEWFLIDGLPKEVRGYWLVETDKNDKSLTVVHYSNYVDAGTLVPGFLVRKFLYEDIEKMVPNIIKRVESGGKWVSDEYMDKKRDH